MSNARLRLHAAGDLRSRDLAQDLAQERPGSELRDLFAPLDRLLVSGGDARLAVNSADGRNAYSCQPWPAPDTLSFSSSTATSISQRAYERAGCARDSLMQSAIALGLHDAFDARIEEMRDELKAHLGLSRADVEVVFSASGTDSQLQALSLTRSLLGAPLTTVIVAADQTGSGTAHTALGRHFSDRTANGSRVRKGEPIGGLAESLTSIALPVTNADGNVRPQAQTDLLVLGAVERAIAGGAKVLLQVMDCSKLGWRLPSDQCVREISARWPHDVQIVVDACQMRLGRRRIGAYLDRGYMVIVTGSKYFTGPPFSGAVLVPEGLSRTIDAVDGIAAGLLEYSVRSDWPKRWGVLRSHFPDRPNFGQWLRWEAALEEIGAYYRVPDTSRRAAVLELGTGIAQIIGTSPSLRLLPLPRNAPGGVDDDEMALPTIFPFTMERAGRALAPDDCRDIYRALGEDSRDVVAADRAAAGIAAPACLVGQPVEFGLRDGTATAALRICVDARHVIAAWSADADAARRNLQCELGRAAAVVAKIEWLLGHADQRTIPGREHGN
jgi:hypothetical protein